ncbi:hypothetical protein SAMN05660473_02129 [Arthrobacter sp. 49Tsu3.1M3]|nr:hypothetical protein SAMN05660473_02129 [Arthrobacter sp. 49Tsu3.1M3]
MCGTTTGVLRERYQDVVLVFMHPFSAGYELDRWYELQEFFCQHLLGKVFKEHTRARLYVENVHSQTISGSRQALGPLKVSQLGLFFNVMASMAQWNGSSSSNAPKQDSEPRANKDE